MVDDTKIAVWGLCFDGNIVLATAAMEYVPRIHMSLISLPPLSYSDLLMEKNSKRIGAVISFAPMMDISGEFERREPILELSIQDRIARLAGEEPLYLPVVTDDGTMPLGQVIGAAFFGTLERLKIPVENKVQVQTYYRALNWKPLNVIHQISPTPVMMVTPENDQVCPVPMQKAAFERLGEPKVQCILPGKGHFDWMFGDMDAVLNQQLDFLKKYLKF